MSGGGSGLVADFRGFEIFFIKGKGAVVARAFQFSHLQFQHSMRKG
jgi:hypothetical protein